MGTQICGLISREQGIPLESLTRDTRLEEVNADSMQIITLLFEIENEFDISIPDERLRSMRTLGDVFDCVDELVAGIDKHNA